jgi:hypothetical protein
MLYSASHTKPVSPTGINLGLNAYQERRMGLRLQNHLQNVLGYKGRIDHQNIDLSGASQVVHKLTELIESYTHDNTELDSSIRTKAYQLAKKMGIQEPLQIITSTDEGEVNLNQLEKMLKSYDWLRRKIDKRIRESTGGVNGPY